MSCNFNNTHELINRQQNYFLNRIPLTIHSEDRDIFAWPNSNNFEINLPATYENVQSIRLIQISFPNKLYSFSKKLDNTSFKLVDKTNSNFYINIEEGTYKHQELANELTNKLNSYDGKPTDQNFLVKYNKINNKYYFSSNSNFNLDFSQKEYPDSNIINNNVNWGLGYNIGFNKKLYSSNTDSITFDYLENSNVFNGYDNKIEATNCSNLQGDTSFYMEIEKYNSYNELYPYTSNNNSAYNNKYGGRINSSFAKIPINNDNTIDFCCKTLNGSKSLYGFTNFEPPLERLSKFKFKFRYHDGRLVDFNNQQFNFTIEINTLTNEINKDFVIRVPEIL